MEELVEADRTEGTASRENAGTGLAPIGSGPGRMPGYCESDSQVSTHSPSEPRIGTSDEAANEALRDQTRIHVTQYHPANTTIPPSEGLLCLGYEADGTILMTESPGTANEFGGMYSDGPMPDVPVEWLEDIWCEMGEMEDKKDRDNDARVLLEALKEGDLEQCMS